MSSPSLSKHVAPLLVALIAVALYASSLHFELLHYDDDAYVWRNPTVARGLSTSGFMSALSDNSGNLWHPLTILSHQFAFALGGTDPRIHHAVNVALFAAVAYLLTVWLSSFGVGRGILAALLVAVLWVCHPQRVEVVAWVSARKDLLCTGFILLTLIAAGRIVQPHCVRHRKGWLMLAIAGTLAACASKPSAVVLPALLVLSFLMNHFSREAQPVRSSAFFWLLIFSLFACGATAVVTMQVQAQGGHSPLISIWGWQHRLGLPPLVLAESLQSTLWPHPAELMRLFPDHLFDTRWWIGIALFLLFTSCSVLAWRKGGIWKMLLLAWCWWLICLAPSSGLFPVGNEYFVDRYNTLPQLGLLPPLVCLLRQNDAKWLAGLASVCAMLAFITLQQLAPWKSDLTLFSSQAAQHPQNHKVLVNFANAQRRAGETTAAERLYRRVLEIQPEEYKALFNLATTLIDDAQTALKTRVNGERASTLLDEAESLLKHAILSQEARAQAWTRLAQTQLLQRRERTALETLDAGLKYFPDDAGMWELKGRAHQVLGAFAEAREAYQRAFQLAPHATHLQRLLDELP